MFKRQKDEKVDIKLNNKLIINLINMRIKDIQYWERDFVKSKGFSSNKEDQIKIAVSKLVEETAEVVKAVLGGQWKEVQAEVSDVIIFACKIANVAEDFFDADELEKVLKRKIEYSETRELDSKRGLNKLNKPKNKEFK